MKYHIFNVQPVKLYYTIYCDSYFFIYHRITNPNSIIAIPIIYHLAAAAAATKSSVSNFQSYRDLTYVVSTSVLTLPHAIKLAQ